MTIKEPSIVWLDIINFQCELCESGGRERERPAGKQLVEEQMDSAIRT